MTIAERQKQFVDEFAALSSWEERYKQLIRMGQKLPPFPEDRRTEQYQVKGCQSQVWLFAGLDPHGRVEFVADSDALIVKGLVALLIAVFSKATPDEILSAPSLEFLQKMDLGSHLSPSRANGLYAMLKQMMYYAAAFKALR